MITIKVRLRFDGCSTEVWLLLKDC